MADNFNILDQPTGGGGDVTNPLTADLDVGGFSIISVSNGNITLAPNGSGIVNIEGQAQAESATFPPFNAQRVTASNTGGFGAMSLSLKTTSVSPPTSVFGPSLWFYAVENDDTDNEIAVIEGRLDGSLGTGQLVLRTYNGGVGAPALTLSSDKTGQFEGFLRVNELELDDPALLVNAGGNVSTGNVSSGLAAHATIRVIDDVGTPAQDSLGAGISFSRIGTTRRGVLLASSQDTTDADQQGFKIFTREATSTSDDSVNTDPAVHLTYDNQVLTNGGAGRGAESGSVHIHTGNSGLAPGNVSSAADDCVIENNGSAGITVLTPNTDIGSIFFGDPEDVDAGGFRYSHSSDTAQIRIAGATRFVGSTSAWYPNVDDSADLGRSDKRYNTVYATNGTINTSDRDLKQNIRSLKEAELSLAKRLKSLICSYQWKDTKDDGIYFGVSAQDVEQAFRDEGLNPWKYKVVHKNEVSPHNKITYGVNYTQLFALIISIM